MLFGGTSRSILERAISGEITVITSPALLEELEHTLVVKFEWPPQTGRAAREAAANLAEVVHPRDVPTVSRDPDDDIVVATALAGGAAVIVTGDADLLVMGEHGGIAIEAPAAFERRMDEAPD